MLVARACRQSCLQLGGCRRAVARGVAEALATSTLSVDPGAGADLSVFLRRVAQPEWTLMKLIDVHSHWGTRRGYPLQTEAELAQQRSTWNSETRYHTEAEMAEHFRLNRVRSILDLGYAKYRPIEEMRALHDYGFETEAAHPDVILGHWIHIDPQRSGAEGVSELRRCIDKKLGFLGFAVSASLSPPASDPCY